MNNEPTLYRRNLPHLRLTGAHYFVTWRIMRGQHVLSTEERTLVRSAILHFTGVRYNTSAGVVMDDNVHVITCPVEGIALETIIHSWKSFTANKMQRAHGRQGVVWQPESFDRVLRDEVEFDEKLLYIRKNPWKRWPDIQTYEWLWPQDGD
jgi:REP element-mobilizing transposase RayT